MKNKLRVLMRNSSFVAKIIRVLSFFPFPWEIKRKLIGWYLQSEGDRPYLEETVKRYIQMMPLLASVDSVVLSKSAIIKACSAVERGVILVGFEHELDKLLANPASSDLLQKYDILFMPTWQPFYSEALLRALKAANDRIILLPSSESCYYKALCMPGLFRAMPFHASSWINADLYSSSQDKDIDILMVANFSTYKRHYLLFEALINLPKDLKVILVGRPLANRTANDIRREAKKYGVENRFELVESAPNEVVADYLSRAKLVLGLSGREGSYVSLAEALFADAAVGVYANAHIGTKDYINPKTGFLFQSDVPLYLQIKEALKVVETLAPRQWAVANISSAVNVSRLNLLLKQEAYRRACEWHVDIDPFFIQSFQIEPAAGRWSDAIEAEVLRYEQAGLSLRTQLLKINKRKNVDS